MEFEKRRLKSGLKSKKHSKKIAKEVNEQVPEEVTETNNSIESSGGRCKPWSNGFTQINLVADIGGGAFNTDPDVVNPWGAVTVSNEKDFWVGLNGTGLLKEYDAYGNVLARVPIANDGTENTGSVSGLIKNNLIECIPTDFTIIICSCGGKSGCGKGKSGCGKGNEMRLWKVKLWREIRMRREI